MAHLTQQAVARAGQEPPDTDNVVALPRRPPTLTGAETAAVREMLAQWEFIRRSDPMIRWLLDEE